MALKIFVTVAVEAGNSLPNASCSQVDSGAAATVHRSMAAVLDTLSGETVRRAVQPENVFEGSGVPIGIDLPPKISRQRLLLKSMWILEHLLLSIQRLIVVIT